MKKRKGFIYFACAAVAVFQCANTSGKHEIMNEKNAVSRFAALSHELRYKVFRLLATRGDKGYFAGEIATCLDVPASTLSPHLSRLEREKLVARDKQGSHILYKVNPVGVSELIDHLIEDCCEGRPELCGGAASRRQSCAE